MKKFLAVLPILLFLGVVIFFSVKIYQESKPKPAPIHQTASLIPNKHQEPYNFSYQYNNIEISVFEGDSYYNADKTAKYYGFNVWYTNIQNAPESYPIKSLKAIDIGCIAANNQNFIENFSIFSGNQTALKASAPTGTLAFAPFEVKKLSIQLPSSCQYVGTADRQYWWDVPKYGQ